MSWAVVQKDDIAGTSR